MMIDLKPEINQALLHNEILVSLLGGEHIYPQECPDDSIATYVTFQELTNFDDRYTDDTAFSSEIHFQVDVWTKGNTGPIALEVNRSMESIGFARTSTIDLSDKTTKTYHKVLRYKTIKVGG